MTVWTTPSNRLIYFPIKVSLRRWAIAWMGSYTSLLSYHRGKYKSRQEVIDYLESNGFTPNTELVKVQKEGHLCD